MTFGKVSELEKLRDLGRKLGARVQHAEWFLHNLWPNTAAKTPSMQTRLDENGKSTMLNKIISTDTTRTCQALISNSTSFKERAAWHCHSLKNSTQSADFHLIPSRTRPCQRLSSFQFDPSACPNSPSHCHLPGMVVASGIKVYEYW